MASRQILNSNPVLMSKRRESLLWSLQNFTQDFLAESLRSRDARAYANFLNSNRLSFRIADWISTTPNSRNTSRISTTTNGRTSSARASPSARFAYTHRQAARAAFHNSLGPSQVSPRYMVPHNTPTQSELILELNDILSDANPSQHISRLLTVIKNLKTDPSSAPELLRMRRSIYAYVSASISHDRIEIVNALFDLVRPAKRSKYDFAAKIQAYLDLDPAQVEPVFVDALKTISKAGILELLYSTFRHVYRPNSNFAVPDPSYFCFHLYMTVLLRQYGTVCFLDVEKHKTERNILRYLMNKNTRFVTVLKKLMEENPAFGQMLATTCLDLEYKIHNNASAIDIWDAKEQLHLASTLDLQKAMSALLHTKDYDRALAIYKRNPDIHADWLFDTLLKTYAYKQDWASMQQVFESLFGRGKLPNINHYRIVMEALSKIAGVDVVDTMYDNIKARKLAPTIAIHNAIMFSRYALGDIFGVKEAYDRIAADGLRPNLRTFTIKLMAYSDAHDLASAKEVLAQMQQQDVPITREILTTMISLCSKRYDIDGAERIFSWLKQKGMHPDLICYNAMIECYMNAKAPESAERLLEEMKAKGISMRIDTITILFKHYARMKQSDKLSELYAEMSRLQILPDAKFYSVMLEYLVRTDKFNEAETIIKELDSTELKNNIYHYSILMKGYLDNNQYNQVIEIFQELERKHIEPTFETVALMIEAYEQSMRGSGIGNQVLQDYMSKTDELVDLTSKYVPRNVVSPEMVVAVLKGHAERLNLDQVKLVIEAIKDMGAHGKRLLENDIVLRRISLIFGKFNEWGLFTEYSNRLMEVVRTKFVQTRNGQYRLPPALRLVDDKVFRYKFIQLADMGQRDKIFPLYKTLKAKGFAFSNYTINTIVPLLVEDPATITHGYELAERELLGGSLRAIEASQMERRGLITADQKSRFIGHKKMSITTRQVLAQYYYKFLETLAQQMGVSPRRAYFIYRAKHKDLLGHLQWVTRDNHFPPLE